MTWEEYLEKSDRKGLEDLLLWCMRESHGEESWLYRTYTEIIDKITIEEMKCMIEIHISNMIPSDVNNILDVLASLGKENDVRWMN